MKFIEANSGLSPITARSGAAVSRNTAAISQRIAIAPPDAHLAFDNWSGQHSESSK
jgi:hypothetical protein